MLLRSVRVENFRAIKSAVLSLGNTTVLIGENDCGRSSVMEAVALVLGWDSKPGEFRFQPYHIHRVAHARRSAPPIILIVLEFSESVPGEWDGEGFETLRNALPDALTGDRRFWLEVRNNGEGASRWAFLSAARTALSCDHKLLAWLRRRKPVLWMKDGMLASKMPEVNPATLPDGTLEPLTAEVTQNYQDLLRGTALDISAAIQNGSAAARELLLSRMKLARNHATPLAEVLEGIAEKKQLKQRAPEPLRRSGSAAQNIGILLLVGTLLRMEADRLERGMDALTLIEDPEAHLHPTTLASIWNLIDRIGGQKIIATHSGTVLACARLSSVRRLTRHEGLVKEWRVPDGTLTADELRRYSYHLRSRRAAASFARCWLLVEGETEYWLMNELARVCGYELAGEGVVCVEFAQCGLDCLIKVARHLGIEWHLLADGDLAGRNYANAACRLAGAGGVKDHITLLEEPDIEHCFWRHGYSNVFRRAAYPHKPSTEAAGQSKAPARQVIRRAVERHSKPYVAVLLLEALIDRGPAGVPPPLRNAIECCIRLAHGEHPQP